MLSVSFSLALVAAMLFGIVLPGHHKEVDKFNGQTHGPIPTGHDHVVSEISRFKVAEELSQQENASGAFGNTTCGF